MGHASHLDHYVPGEIRERVARAKSKDVLGWEYPYKKKMGRFEYEEQKLELQIELLKMQNWVAETGEKIVMLFEGRDAGGKGGTVNRFMEHMNPRGARVVALQKPTLEEQGQWYFQRYIENLPTKGEIVFFDRSWYNRAVVEPVMGFCTEEENKVFLEQAPLFEKMLIQSGVRLFKFWFSVSRPEQFRRFKSRETDRLKQWKLSPVDKQSLSRWDDYSHAIANMFQHTDSKHAPWIVIRSDDKKRARLNCMRYVLDQIPYDKKNEKIAVPPDPMIIGPAKKMYSSFKAEKSKKQKK
jgi:polyphosphate kinase 2